jgi:hypothetical protein
MKITVSTKHSSGLYGKSVKDLDVSEEKICKTICKAVSGVDLLVHARACEQDVLAAINGMAQLVQQHAEKHEAHEQGPAQPLPRQCLLLPTPKAL